MILSSNGKYAVVSERELADWGINYIARSGGRCPCGGPDAQQRAVDGMARSVAHGTDPIVGTLTAQICSEPGQLGYAIVRVADLPLVQGTFAVPASPAGSTGLSDWPLSCPKCKRPSSAYLGLNSYDCKHGCFK